MRQSEDLGFLAIWQFLAAGYTFLLACIPAVLAFVNQHLGSQESANPVLGLPGEIADRLAVHLAWVPVTLGLALAILFAIAGRSMLRHQNLKLLQLAASLQLPFFPVGTVAGILALRALTRTEIQKYFSNESAGCT